MRSHLELLIEFINRMTAIITYLGHTHIGGFDYCYMVGIHGILEQYRSKVDIPMNDCE